MHEDHSLLWSHIPNNRMLRWHADITTESGMTVWREAAEFSNGHARKSGALPVLSMQRQLDEGVAVEQLRPPFGGIQLGAARDCLVWCAGNSGTNKGDAFRVMARRKPHRYP